MIAYQYEDHAWNWLICGSFPSLLLLFTGPRNLKKHFGGNLARSKGYKTEQWRPLSSRAKHFKFVFRARYEASASDGEQDKKVGQRQPVEVVAAIELLQDLIQSLIPSSSEGDPDGQPDQIKLISQGSKYARTRKLISLEKPIEGVQLDIDLLNFVGVVKVCDLLNGILKSPTFLYKLSISSSNSEEFPERQVDESSSWNLISEADLLMVGPNHLKNCINQESYVAVTYKDVEEGIASYTASYLSTLKEMKEMTPEQLRKALEKTFSVPKNKGRLHKLWDGSKTIYNIVSWGATATGKYNNSAVGRVASAALSIPWRKITKLGSK